MKSTVIRIAVCLMTFTAVNLNFAQDVYSSLEGKSFKCRLTEITPPDVDRMPRIILEEFRFTGRSIASSFLKTYITEDIPFSAQIDERRAVAFTVVDFNSNAEGTKDNLPVKIDFKGSIVGFIGLNGELSITYNGIEEKYMVESLQP